MDLFTLGETLICLSAVQEGRLETISTFRKSIGGAESNTAIGLARLGCSVSWTSRVGDDGLGQEILKTLRGEGVDVSNVARTADPTGLMLKEYRAPGDIHVHYYRRGSAAAGLGPSDVDEEQVACARRVHLTGVTLALGPGPRAALHRILSVCKAQGIPVSFDPNLRLKLWSLAEAAAACAEVFPFVSDLLLNEREAVQCTGASNLDEAVEALSRFGFDSIVVKRGKEGVVGYRGGKVVREAAARVKVVDSVGAGDAFNAGYLFASLNGYSFQRSLALGNWVAGHVVSHRGDYEGLPMAGDYRAWADQTGRVKR